jgi:hypothetical protein
VNASRFSNAAPVPEERPPPIEVIETEFGVGAFAETILKICFYYLAFYANEKQQAMTSYAKVVWSVAYLRHSLDHAAYAARKAKYSKQKEMKGDDLVDYVPKDPCFARASPEEFNALRAWVVKKYKTTEKAFRAWDFNGSGLLGDSEWFKALSELGFTEDTGLAKRLFRSFDVFDKNFVTKQTFDLLYNGATGTDGSPPPGSPKKRTDSSGLSPMAKLERADREAAEEAAKAVATSINEMVGEDERVKKRLFREFPYPERPPTPNPRIMRLLDENVERHFKVEPPPQQLSFRHQFERREGVNAALGPRKSLSVGAAAWKKSRLSVKNFLADEKGEERPNDTVSMLEKITAAAKALKAADDEAEQSASRRASKQSVSDEPRREPAIPLHTIQVRMAYGIPPKHHAGWDDKCQPHLSKPRSLVTPEEETKWRDPPWKLSEDMLHVECTICNGRFHIDKDWGNPNCWGCSIVDRMELGGNLFVKLLSPPVLAPLLQAAAARKAPDRKTSLTSEASAGEKEKDAMHATLGSQSKVSVLSLTSE